jgi:hypothetical protein
VVNPNLLRCLNANVVDWSEALGNFEVADDNVVRVEHAETDTGEG